MLKFYPQNVKNLWMLAYLFITVMLINNQAFTQTLPSGFKHEKVAAMNFPTAYAQAPDGRFFVSTSIGGKGNVYVIKNGNLLATPFYTINKVYTNKEKGLVGIAFDPEFGKNTGNDYVYLYYTDDLSGGTQNGKAQNKIIKIKASASNPDVADPASLSTVLQLDEITTFLVNYNHDGGTMHFGPDGKLYVAVGENTLWCNAKCINLAQNNCTGCDPFEPATYAQDMNFYHGKILRINKDGSAPTDNPFYEIGGSNQKNRIYVVGVRNPYSMHFRKGTNELWFNDVGSTGGASREEINKVSYSMVNGKISSQDKNFGWNMGTSQPMDATPPSLEGTANKAGFQDPVRDYAHPQKDTKGNFIPSNDLGCAITGGVFYEPQNPTFPTQYVGKYFFFDFCMGWVKYMNADGTGMTTFATGLAGNANGGGGNGSILLEEGMDGNLYHLVRSSTANVSGLYRIVGPNSVSTKDEQENKYSFSVHPNPAKDVLNIHLTGLTKETGKLIISDAMSKETMKFNLDLTPGFFDQNFDISNLKRGVYFVTLQTLNGSVTKKLVVE